MRGPARWRHRGRAGVSPIIGVVLILGMTVAAGMILWMYRPPLPPSPVTVEYVASGDQSEPAWGDPTDCSNTTINANCDNLPAFFIIFTSHSPDAIPLTSLALELRCNGTSLVNGTFKAMEVVPGSGANPSSSSPKLGKCGTWSPSPIGNTATYFNRLLYFQQVSVGSPTLKNGDLFVVYTHPAADFCDRSNHCPDDDFHGAPPWCFTVQSACEILITYTAHPVSLVATIPVWALSG
ncbi:MAG TPA: type IV pilin N-terminal domain-containing protein [Thermoplasmata archaeon]